MSRQRKAGSGQRTVFSFLGKLLAASGVLCAACFLSVSAANKPKLPKGELREPVIIDLLPPQNLQSQVIKKSVVLSWAWLPPDPAPEFLDFGFEVERRDGKSWIVAEQGMTDYDVQVGSYTYRARARGTIKEKGKKISHASRWVGPLEAEVLPVCPDVPKFSIRFEPMEKRYSKTPSLRIRVTGSVSNPTDCHNMRIFYTLDSGTGIHRTGSLTPNAQGRISEFIDALQPGDEIVTGDMTFTISATAENEAGPVTPGETTLVLQTENPYAPKEPF